MAARDSLTIRQTYERVLPSMGHVTFKGSVTQVADEMEDWYRSKPATASTSTRPSCPGRCRTWWTC